MILTRTLKRWICLLVASVMLLAQMNIAAYACPGMGMGMGMGMGSAHANAMANCEQMADHTVGSKNQLCAEHCHPTQQSDHTQVPSLPLMLLIGLYTVPSLDSVLPRLWPAQAALDSRLEAAPPPLSIQHCCFRL